MGRTLALFALVALPHASPAQQIVVSVAPGSSTDLIARLVAPKLGAALGRHVAVENRAGAGGAIGARQVKNAAPDGDTLLATSVAFAVNATLYPDAGYDPLKDFAAVALAGSTINVIAVNPSVPATDLKELLALARRERLAYASSGIGTTTHLSIERLKVANKLQIAHLARQPAQAVSAAVAGEVPISSTSLPPALPQIRAGRLRAIAVTGAQRSPRLPEVPTVAESGYPGFDDVTWFGFFAPAGTPAKTLERLNAEINRALSSPEAQARFAELGLDFKPLTQPQFAAYLRAEVQKWGKAVKDSGAKPE